MKTILAKCFFLLCLCSLSVGYTQSIPESAIPWWKKNNLRVIQCNLPAYEAATLNPDSLVADLVHFAANTLIINAGGIMAFYPSGLESHYINPYMQPTMLRDVVDKCHRQKIKVIVRFDFSRLDQSIFEKHPDWVYVDKEGQHMINTDKYVTCINAPYVQEEAFKIVSEVIDLYPVDGIFLNMPGYQNSNAYVGKYHGIDQNEHDKKRFNTWNGGLTLPTVEDRNDPVYLQYLQFRKFTTDEWQMKLAQVVKSKNPDIAICTYATDHVDIIRHESQTNSLPYFPYNASDNVNVMMTTYPDHIVSNASIQQISFQSRYNAIEPEESEIRLWENIANGSGLDLSLMGDLRGYEDERNYPVIEKIYNHHKKFESYYGRYQSIARIALVAPGWWPHGPTMQEYRGIQLMLNEAHIPYDRIEDSQLSDQYEKLKQYKLVILPDIQSLNTSSLECIRKLNEAGVSMLATNGSFKNHPEDLKNLFGAEIKKAIEDGSGHYIGVDDHTHFPSLPGQSMVLLKFNLGEYDLSGCDEKYLPILAVGRPGPPEMIGGHDPTGYFSVGIKRAGLAKNAILPLNLGRLYYLHGYEDHKHIVLDLIQLLYPLADQAIVTDAHPRIETILHEYMLNNEATYRKPFKAKGLILHLINLTGFSGNTYFKPSRQDQIHIKIVTSRTPRVVKNLDTNLAIPFTYKSGMVSFVYMGLVNHGAVVMDY